jgi:hypothetical protein
MEIEPVVPYDSNRDNYDALARYAKKEHDEDMRPAIKNKLPIEMSDAESGASGAVKKWLEKLAVMA